MTEPQGEPQGGVLVAVANGVDHVIGVVCRAVVLVTVIVLLCVLGANLVARYLLAQGRFASG